MSSKFLTKFGNVINSLLNYNVNNDGSYALQITGLIAVLVAVLFYSLKNRRRKQAIFEKYNIPYVKPHPIYGSLHKLKGRPNSGDEISVMENWVKTYGKHFGFFVGVTPHLVVTDLDSVREILIRNSSNYLNRPKLAIKAEPVVNTLVGLRNNRWKEVRGMVSHAFTASKIKSLVGIMNEKVDVLVSLIEKHNENNVEIEWLSLYQGLTLEVISKCAFAMETNCMKEQNRDPFFASVRDFLDKALNSAVLWAQYFPFIAAIMAFVNNYWMKSGKATQMIVANLKSAIERRRKFVDERKRDILQILLDNAEEDRKTKDSKVKPLSDREIVANSWVFLLGGYETTASALTFTTYLLAKHPEIQEKLYNEIKENILEDKELTATYENVMGLTYLDQVLSESLRLYPPVTTFLQREASEEDRVNGIVIPKETTVVIPIWHIHHNPEYWNEPYKFDPERFSSQAKADLKRHQMSFLPFGAGPRNCIGMKFGQVAAKIALTRIVSTYRLEMCDETPDPLNVKIQTVTLLPKEEVYLRAVRRD